MSLKQSEGPEVLGQCDGKARNHHSVKCSTSMKKNIMWVTRMITVANNMQMPMTCPTNEPRRIPAPPYGRIPHPPRLSASIPPDLRGPGIIPVAESWFGRRLPAWQVYLALRMVGVPPASAIGHAAAIGWRRWRSAGDWKHLGP